MIGLSSTPTKRALRALHHENRNLFKGLSSDRKYQRAQSFTVLRVHERRRVIFKDLSSGAVTLKITKVPKATARVLTTLTTLISFGSNQLYCAHMLYYLQVTTIISELKEYSE